VRPMRLLPRERLSWCQQAFNAPAELSGLASHKLPNTPTEIQRLPLSDARYCDCCVSCQASGIEPLQAYQRVWSRINLLASGSPMIAHYFGGTTSWKVLSPGRDARSWKRRPHNPDACHVPKPEFGYLLPFWSILAVTKRLGEAAERALLKGWACVSKHGLHVGRSTLAKVLRVCAGVIHSRPSCWPSRRDLPAWLCAWRLR
jgi:hypothetical protein